MPLFHYPSGLACLMHPVSVLFPMNRSHSLHHLPGRGQNVFYIFFLLLSPAFNIGINLYVYEKIRQISERGSRSFSALNWVSEISGVVLGVLIALMGLNLVFALSRHRHARRALMLFGVFSSLYLLLNFYTVWYGIFVFNVQSSVLLLVSLAMYLSLNIVFLLWYWYLDFPSQVKRLHCAGHPVQIVFPGGSSLDQASRLPSFVDYLYFTVMTSNTLASPESHFPSGIFAKIVQVVHSVCMLVMLVVFVSRAVNTLP